MRSLTCALEKRTSQFAMRGACRSIWAAGKFFEIRSFRYAALNFWSGKDKEFERAADLLRYPLIHFDWMNS